MKIGTGPIVIPWDFTEVAENAFEYAVPLSSQFNNEHIALIHIVKKLKDKDQKYDELKQIAEEKSKKHQMDVKAFVEVGKVMSEIGNFAKKNEAELIVMGTHGVSGIQKINGSRALKVVVKAKEVPFVVLNKPIKYKKINKVVFPIQHKTETKEKLNLVSFLSELSNPTFHMFKPNYSDDGFKKKARTNLSFCKQYMENRGINYELEICQGSRSFEEELLDYSKRIEADLILIISPKSISFLDHWTGMNEQRIMHNEEGIPVMIQNPIRGLMKYQTFY